MRQVDALMSQAVESRVFPGAVLLAAKGGQIVYHKAFGFLDHIKTGEVSCDTVYDLASLTKALAATAAVMLLADHGRMGTGDRLGDLIQEMGDSDKTHISIGHLLCHNAGLPAWRPYYQQLYGLDLEKRKDQLHKLLAAEPLIYPAGTKTLYSDVGFMILQWAVEKTTGMGLDQYVAKCVYEPVNISDLFFLPLADPQNASRLAGCKIAATGVDANKGLIRGRVNDENAFAMGGVSGHAGLFGTAKGVFELLSEFMETYWDAPGRRVFSRWVVKEFFTIPQEARRALGFDVPDHQHSSSGRFFSPNTSVGHLGFTGTSFWMDPVEGIIVILLSNRVCPDPENKKIVDFRPKLHDMVVSCLQS